MFETHSENVCVNAKGLIRWHHEPMHIEIEIVRFGLFGHLRNSPDDQQIEVYSGQCNTANIDHRKLVQL